MRNKKKRSAVGNRVRSAIDSHSKAMCRSHRARANDIAPPTPTMLLSHGEEFEAMVRVARETAAAIHAEAKLLWLEAVDRAVVGGLFDVTVEWV